MFDSEFKFATQQAVFSILCLASVDHVYMSLFMAQNAIFIFRVRYGCILDVRDFVPLVLLATYLFLKVCFHAISTKNPNFNIFKFVVQKVFAWGHIEMIRTWAIGILEISLFAYL
jgi:hypothetical protein